MKLLHAETESKRTIFPNEVFSTFRTKHDSTPSGFRINMGDLVFQQPSADGDLLDSNDPGCTLQNDRFGRAGLDDIAVKEWTETNSMFDQRAFGRP